MSIGSDLLRFADRKIVLFDLETQCLNLLDSNLPFECAWIVVQRNRVLERHRYYLRWPNFRMSADAARITRFNPQWVINGDDPEYVLDAFESYALDESFLLAGHNVLCFDSPVWQLWRRALGRKPDWRHQARILDTHLLSRAYKMGWKPDRENLLAWQYKVAAGHQKGVKTGLSLMAKELDVPVDETRTHEAIYDIEVNAGVLWKLANLLEI